ncbi:MAG: AraC family ligand binding domain-containing protein [Candidatus Anammoxibacter sp.]
MKLVEDELIKSIITRLKGVIDEEKAKKIYEMSGITVKDDGDVTIEGKHSIAVDKLLRNLVKDGDYLVKITLHNIAQENDLKLCPLCKEMNETENIENSCESEEDLENDMTAKILHSTPSKKIVLITLRNGASLDDHATDCPIMVLCVSGKGTFEYNGTTQDFKEGDLINLDAKVVHNVHAKDKLEILITKMLAA